MTPEERKELDDLKGLVGQLQSDYQALWNAGMDRLVTGNYIQIGSSGNQGAVRLNRKALQVATRGIADGGLWFVQSLVPEPDEEAMQSYVNGLISDTQASIFLTANAESDPTAQFEARVLPNGTGTAEMFVQHSAGSVSAYAGLELAQARTWGQFQLSNTALLFLNLTADPGTLADGMAWYNHTDDQFKFYEGSTIKTLGGGGVTPNVISPLSDLSVGTDLAALAVSAPSSGAWPDANRAILIPFRVPSDITVKQLFSYNGATASGNIDVGIYDSSFARLVSSGSTAQSGTNTTQAFNITDTALSAGLYYMAVAMNNGTGTLFVSSTPTAVALRAMGVYQMASAFPLPSTITPANPSDERVPIVGWTTETVI